MLNENKELKTYYSVAEVAEMFNVASSLLRYWESMFPSINPQKAGRGIRQYSKDDIEEVRLVYHYVKEKGMTIEGARNAIDRLKNGETNLAEVNHRIEAIDRLKVVRDELQRIGRELQELSS